MKLFDATDTTPGQSLSGVIHRCDVCGRRARWNDRWSFYGSVSDDDDGIVLKLCGCKRRLSQSESEQMLGSKRVTRGQSRIPRRRKDQ